MNFLRNIVLICISVLTLSCNKSSVEISDETLARIIADMHISEVSIMRHDLQLQDSISPFYLEKIEAVHGIDREIIKREVETLQEDKKRQSEIYTMVIAILQDLEKEIKKQKDSSNKNSNE